jgi:hypothetical protein
MNLSSKLSVAALGMAALISSANGAITGVTGATTWLGSPPLTCLPGALNGFNAYTWDEQQGITLATLAVDEINNPGGSASPTAGLLGGTFDSHFIHFDGIPGVINAQGTVTFATSIVGVIFVNTSLDNTDLTCGSLSTFYPTTWSARGINTVLPSGFTVVGNTITFSLSAIASLGEVAQIRVITTAVPAPGAATLLGLGGLAIARRRRG